MYLSIILCERPIDSKMHKSSIKHTLTLETLRSKAFFQNTIDVWIMFCEEQKWDWYDINAYRHFITYLNSKNVKMQKFPLCIKESGGMYERGRDKSKFLEELSHFSSDDASAYTIKLSTDVLSTIRSFTKT
jgi:hypothetical protein